MSVIKLYRHFQSSYMQMLVALGGTVCPLLQFLLEKLGRDKRCSSKQKGMFG